MIPVEDGAVSAHHATITELETGEFKLEDLHTTNGTFVGGVKITSATLADGDKITVGGIDLCFRHANPAMTKPTTKPMQRRSTSGLHTVAMTVSGEMSAVLPLLEQSGDTPVDFVSGKGRKEGELRQDYEKLRAAFDLIRSIAGEDDLDVILHKIVDTVIDLMSAERAAILLMSTDGNLIPRVAKQSETSGEQFEVSTSILSYVAKHRAAVVCKDLGADSRFSGSKSIIMQAVRSAMCVPMLHKGELVGVIHVDSLQSTGHYNQAHLDVISTIANTAAFAIKTAMLKRQIQEMERQRTLAMGAMISGASHFINNPLAVLKANLGMLREWSGTLTSFHQQVVATPALAQQLYAENGIDFIDEEIGPLEDESTKAADRIEAIVAALHVFDHHHDPDAWSDFELAPLIEEAITEQGARLGEIAQVHRQLEAARVHGVPEQLRTVFCHILNNSAQSIEAGTPDKNWIVVSVYTSGATAFIAFDDTGRGISVENRTRVFAPFHTDKLDGSLGLGLAISAEIVRQHDARIYAQGRDGGGTRIVIELPLAQS